MTFGYRSREVRRKLPKDSFVDERDQRSNLLASSDTSLNMSKLHPEHVAFLHKAKKVASDGTLMMVHYSLLFLCSFVSKTNIVGSILNIGF